MPEIISHGAWTRGPDAELPGGMRYQTFAGPDGADWYAHAHARLIDPATVKVLVRDGAALMVERDGTRLVPPGEVVEVPGGVPVERGWLWDGARFAPPPPAPPEHPAAKLRAFLDANPDVATLIA